MYWGGTLSVSESQIQQGHNKLFATIKLTRYLPLQGPVAQSVTSPIADQGVSSLIPARSHSFMEFDHEIISMFILLFLLIQEELLSELQAKVCAQSTSTM